MEANVNNEICIIKDKMILIATFLPILINMLNYSYELKKLYQ